MFHRLLLIYRASRPPRLASRPQGEKLHTGPYHDAPCTTPPPHPRSLRARSGPMDSIPLRSTPLPIGRGGPDGNRIVDAAAAAAWAAPPVARWGEDELLMSGWAAACRRACMHACYWGNHKRGHTGLRRLLSALPPVFVLAWANLRIQPLSYRVASWLG